MSQKCLISALILLGISCSYHSYIWHFPTDERQKETFASSDSIMTLRLYRESGIVEIPLTETWAIVWCVFELLQAALSLSFLIPSNTFISSLFILLFHVSAGHNTHTHKKKRRLSCLPSFLPSCRMSPTIVLSHRDNAGTFEEADRRNLLCIHI